MLKEGNNDPEENEENLVFRSGLGLVPICSKGSTLVLGLPFLEIRGGSSS